MAWDRVRLDNQLYNFFSFFSNNDTGGADGSVKEVITGGDAGETEFFKIKEVRIHLSSPCASVEDFILHLTSIKGSEYDQTFLSQAMSDLTDFLWQPSQPLTFMSGDTFSVYMSLDSGSNSIAINAHGWAIAS